MKMRTISMKRKETAEMVAMLPMGAMAIPVDLTRLGVQARTNTKIATTRKTTNRWEKVY